MSEPTEMWTNDGPAIYLNADKTEVVEEGSPEAAYLLVAEGGQIPLEMAEQYGLTDEGSTAKGAAIVRRRREAKEAEKRHDARDDAAADRPEEENRKAKKDLPPNKGRG